MLTRIAKPEERVYEVRNPEEDIQDNAVGKKSLKRLPGHKSMAVNLAHFRHPAMPPLSTTI
jgi:hypothetical protein